MRHLIILLLAFALFIPAGAQSPMLYEDGLLDDIKPKGWLKSFLDAQKDGMTGKPESMSYPYDSNLWDGEIVRNT
ncbi:MAG: glycosyl hydrolase, partial [Bacteroidales bacterium]|nr:glycosyl hydrolase [Bacteroidales bacterium]